MLTSITNALAAPITVELPAWLYYLMAANLCLTGATFFMKLLDRIDKR